MSPPVAERKEGEPPLVVRHVAVQFVDRAHPAKDAAGACPPRSAVVFAYAVIIVATVSLSLSTSSQDGLHRQEQRVVILNAVTRPWESFTDRGARRQGRIARAWRSCPPPLLQVASSSSCPLAHANPPPSPSPLGTLLVVHSSLLVTVADTSTLRNALAAPTPPPRAAAAPAKPLDDLLHLPPKAAPI